MLLPGFVQLQARRLTNLPCLGNSMHMGNVGRKLGIYRWQMDTTQLIWSAVGSPNAVLQPCRRFHPDAAAMLASRPCQSTDVSLLFEVLTALVALAARELSQGVACECLSQQDRIEVDSAITSQLVGPTAPSFQWRLLRVWQFGKRSYNAQTSANAYSSHTQMTRLPTGSYRHNVVSTLSTHLGAAAPDGSSGWPP